MTVSVTESSSVEVLVTINDNDGFVTVPLSVRVQVIVPLTPLLDFETVKVFVSLSSSVRVTLTNKDLLRDRGLEGECPREMVSIGVNVGELES